MATIECKSIQLGIPSRWVEVAEITDGQVSEARTRLDVLLTDGRLVSDAVTTAFIEVVRMCPKANPSDLWQHVIYRHLLSKGWNDSRWKRTSGFSLESALVRIYESRLAPYDLRMRRFNRREASRFLATLDSNIRPSKVDLFLEYKVGKNWHVLGAAHVKASIAERIQDDVPASQTFMDASLLSIVLTMDAKSYPPPHGDCVNYGELGGRSAGVDKERLKRDYIEEAGQFDGLFSFNLRTPSSPAKTPSGKRIYTMSLGDAQPDQLVTFLMEKRRNHVAKLSCSPSRM